MFYNFQTFQNSVFLTALAASMVSGFFLVVGMTPFDVVATRLFNQGTFFNLIFHEYEKLLSMVFSYVVLQASTKTAKAFFTTTSSIALSRHSRLKECVAFTKDSLRIIGVPRLTPCST